ncbi:MAG: CAP domain-containing protein [Candidatus Paceibacterota bacterium]|jgi:hypothetical protein
MMIKTIASKLRHIFIPCKSNNFRPKFLDSNFLIYYLAILLIVKFIVLPASFCFYQSSYFATLTKEFLVTLTNQERKELGIGELKENSTLDQAAALKAQDMLDLDYFSHNSPEGKSPWYWIKLSGYSYQKAGENLAIGFVDGEEVVQAWNDSPSHRANLVNPGYQEIGIGIAKGDFQGQEVTVVVQMFGAKSSGQASAKAPNASVSAGTSQTAPKIPPEQPSQPVKAAGIEQVSSTTAGQKAIEDPRISQTEDQDPQEEQPVQTSTIALAGTEPEIEGAETQFPANSSNKGMDMREMSIKFLVMGLPNFIEKLNFLSLLVAMIGLFLTIFIEIRVQPKDLLLKGFFFILVFGVLLVFDKTLILRFIPHNLTIV